MLQYAGDYGDAFERFAAGGDETYYAQRYSVDFVGALRQKIDDLTVICNRTPAPYNKLLANGVRAIGAGSSGSVNVGELAALAVAQNPTHVTIGFPDRKLFAWAIQSRLKILGLLADSFNSTKLKEKFKGFLLARQLNHPLVAWVGNHGENSARSLQAIGVNPNKIIPWDWPHSMRPDDLTPKSHPDSKQPFKLVYVGSVIAAKGVGDILDAMPQLQSQGVAVRLKVAGRGDLDTFKARATKLGIADHVEFLGLVPHKQVVHLMREADAVVVPSRHEYPEGFPMTLYEAMCSRTPIVASDHPMFLGKLRHQINAMIFPARQATALAHAIKTLQTDASLYQALSQASAEAWQQLQIPVKWGELIERWLFDSPENRQWLHNRRLKSSWYGKNK